MGEGEGRRIVTTKKQVNAVLVSKKGGPHSNKKRKVEESEVLRKLREAIKQMKERRGDEEEN